MKIFFLNIFLVNSNYKRSILKIINFIFSKIVLKTKKKIIIYFIDETNMEVFNFTFRGFFKPTDSISIKNTEELVIFFCFNYLLNKCLLFKKKNIFKELFFSLIHSILHNLNYNHEISHFDLKKQNVIEKKIYNFFFFK